jgi:hypothetical protein
MIEKLCRKDFIRESIMNIYLLRRKDRLNVGTLRVIAVGQTAKDARAVVQKTLGNLWVSPDEVSIQKIGITTFYKKPRILLMSGD